MLTPVEGTSERPNDGRFGKSSEGQKKKDYDCATWWASYNNAVETADKYDNDPTSSLEGLIAAHRYVEQVDRGR